MGRVCPSQAETRLKGGKKRGASYRSPKMSYFSFLIQDGSRKCLENEKRLKEASEPASHVQFGIRCNALMLFGDGWGKMQRKKISKKRRTGGKGHL